MKHPQHIFAQAQQAFDQWNLMPEHHRIRLVDEMKQLLAEELLAAFEYQYDYAAKTIGKLDSLIGPTGETNELYHQGRGVGLVLVNDEELIGKERGIHQAAIGFIVAMLVTGNTVIVCGNNKGLTDHLTQMLKHSRLPDGVLTICTPENYSILIQQDIRSVAFIGDKANAMQVNRTLSEKIGAIAAFVIETDLINLPTVQDPALALRFVSEKVRSTNITAIGGNTMLLGLGNE